jgi:coenzyme F420-reducing hydrogenase delta subunit
MIDYVLSRDLADGVFITGCREGECYNRFGLRWTEDRLARRRDPYLRARVPRERIGTFWAAPTDRRRLVQAVESFRATLGEPPTAPDATARPAQAPKAAAGKVTADG